MSSTPRFLVASGLAVAVLAVSSPVHADRRAFTHTYEYMTMPKGQLELEFYNTQESATFETDSPTAFEWQVETEYGITERWDVSLYQVFAGAEDGMGGGSGLAPTETKVKTRYRIAERGELPVDIVLYFELIKPFGVAGLGVEPKLIVGRDFGKLTAALNLTVELEPEEEASATETEVEYEVEPEFAFGLTYELAASFKLGAETWGNLDAIESEPGGELYAGPALSWAPAGKMWFAATAGFGLVDTANDMSFRFVLGLSL